MYTEDVYLMKHCLRGSWWSLHKNLIKSWHYTILPSTLMQKKKDTYFEVHKYNYGKKKNVSNYLGIVENKSLPKCKGILVGTPLVTL